MHKLQYGLRDSCLTSISSPLASGYYEYANGWGERALYIRVHYVPLRKLSVEIFIDYPKSEADAGIRITLGQSAARFMSLISPEFSNWPYQGQGVGTLLGNCTVAFLQAIYPDKALLTGWAPMADRYLVSESADEIRERRYRFWARFGVLLDAYNMFDVRIGDLRIVDTGQACLEYFSQVLPVSAFIHAGHAPREFQIRNDAVRDGISDFEGPLSRH